ncbi:MAG: spondin domain-containing protein [Rhodothermia bacterium]
MKQTLKLVPFALIPILVGCSDDGNMLATESSSAISTVAKSGAAALKNGGSESATYEVTIVNMSDSQPFSPGVILTHDDTANLFSSGAAASEGIRLIAEEGNPATAFAALDGAGGVYQVLATTAPVFRKSGPGPSKLTTEIMGVPGEYLSLSVMLICTNDGFVGLDSAKLPEGPETAVYFPNAYDAGTEENDELGASIVGACNAI